MLTILDLMMKRMTKTCFMILIGYICMAATSVDGLQGKVKAVIDGNTLEVVTDEGDTYKIKLSGADCPEIGQSFGKEAKAYTEKLVTSKKVTITMIKRDRHGVRHGQVEFGKNKVLNEMLVKDGYAWVPERNNDQALNDLQATAQTEKKGLWKTETPTPPWVYRRQQTMLGPKGR